MKKSLILVLAALIAVLATACGETDNTIANNKSAVIIQPTRKETAPTNGEKIKEEIVKKATKPNQSATEPTASAKAKKQKKKKKRKNTLPTQGDPNPNTNIQVTTAPNGSFDSSDLDFIFEGAYIYLNDDIEDAIAILGEDNGATELSKTKTEYEFDDVTVVTYEKNEKERVESITVLTDTIPTPKGAKVGMYGTQLRTVYGLPTKKSDTAYTYSIDNKSLVFNLENNIVTSYSYIMSH
ncbi:MAG: hypothetical protein K6F88_01280 [Ruminococcus sp.]|nr:hypothetical protein [Ruminococcus sp.]